MTGKTYRSLEERTRGVTQMPSLLVALITLLVIGGVLTACNLPGTAESESKQEESVAKGPSYAGKKVLLVNSYHAGYAWSDAIEQALEKVLKGKGIALKIVRMDTKRNKDETFRKQAALKAKAEINAFQPDVVIAADDNAQQYLIVPYFKGTGLPVVFCGVNWDAKIYGYPARNVTGMVEVELPSALVQRLGKYAQGKRLGYITVDSNTERKVADIYNQKFFNHKMKVYSVKNWDEFKQVFVSSQNEVDILFIGNNAGIDQWDDETARIFITENTKIPTGTINPWMTPYALMTFAKRPEEQGEWAGLTALRILGGTAVSDIPMVQNKQGKLVVNLDIAGRLGVDFPPYIFKIAETYSAAKG